MEKVTIANATKKDYNGKTFITIDLEDGRTGSSNDINLLDMVGQPVDLEIKLANEYKGVQQYYFNLPKQPKQGWSKAPKDMGFEKRKVALECAVEYARYSTQLTTDQVLHYADKFYEWLNK